MFESFYKSFCVFFSLGSTSERPGTAQSHKLVNGVVDPSENSDKDRDLKKDGGIMDSAVAEAMRHGGSAFSLVRPKTESGMPSFFFSV